MKAYSTREVAELLGLTATHVRSLVRSGVVAPHRDAKGHASFSFQDLVLLRTAKGLRDAHVPARRITKALQSLASQLPTDRPLSAVRVQIDGDRVVPRAFRQGRPASPGRGARCVSPRSPPRRG